jgi:hypothetical protein
MNDQMNILHVQRLGSMQTSVALDIKRMHLTGIIRMPIQIIDQQVCEDHCSRCLTTFSAYSPMLLILSVLLVFSCSDISIAARKLGFQYICTVKNIFSNLSASHNDRSLPLLHLPYATYRASRYDLIEDIYTFTNIRYASPPIGKNRFRHPQRPLNYPKIQDGSRGHSCYQSTPTQFLVARPALEGITQSEDCLFLDLFVPGHVVRSSDVKSKKLGIVHWIFGGGFGMFLRYLGLICSNGIEGIIQWRNIFTRIK